MGLLLASQLVLVSKEKRMMLFNESGSCAQGKDIERIGFT